VATRNSLTTNRDTRERLRPGISPQRAQTGVVLVVVVEVDVGAEVEVGDGAGLLDVGVCAYTACIPVKLKDDTTGTANAVPITSFLMKARRSSPT
jgi:hypothetical protein